jgi:hypothetical protein
MKADFVFELVEGFEAERLLVEGDVVEPGQVAFRLSRGDETRDLVVPFGGLFVGSGSAGPFGVARAVEEEGPVGVSFEVGAATEGVAILDARKLAREGDKLIGRLLWADQIEAGRWEVVFAQMRHEPIDVPAPGPGIDPALREKLEERIAEYLWVNGAGSRRANPGHAHRIVSIVEAELR